MGPAVSRGLSAGQERGSLQDRPFPTGGWWVRLRKHRLWGQTEAGSELSSTSEEPSGLRDDLPL